MNNNNNKFSQTSNDCKSIIESMLTDINALPHISKSFFTSSTFHVKSRALLAYVATNYQAKVQEMSDANLLLAKIDFSDLAGRTFKRISAYQYALWSLNSAMAHIIEEKACHIPGEQGDQIRKALHTQRNELMNNGVTYTLNDITYHESFYQCKTLLEAYQTFVENYAAYTFDEVEQACMNIGREQRLMPFHLLQAMCSRVGSDFSQAATCINTAPSLEPADKNWNKETVANFIEGLGIDFMLLRKRNSSSSSESEGYGATFKLYDDLIGVTAFQCYDHDLGIEADAESFKKLFTTYSQQLNDEPILIEINRKNVLVGCGG